jgi:branched-chain amino acid transport system ATP-binding protein
MALLELENVSAGYGACEVLRDVSLALEAGEIATVIGANGAGKTTTLNTISGLVRARQGRISLGGTAIHDAPAHHIVGLGVSQSPEGRKIFSRLTVLENLKMGAFTRRDKPGVAKDLAHVLDLFPILSERQHQSGGTLSGGEQQMLAIARALMARPKVLLLDEPSLGLAPLIVLKIFEVIQKLNKEDGVAVLLVEQNARMALKLAHRGYVMETGRITLSGRAADLLNNAKVQDAYLGE